MAAGKHGKRPRPEVSESADRVSVRKRARATRACDQCRRRKERCDSGQPSCGYCRGLNLDCNYSPPKRRGLRAGQLRSLEILLGLIFQSIEGSESWIYTLLEGAPPHKPTFRFRVPEAATAEDATESLLDACRKSAVLKHAESLISATETAEDDDESPDSTITFENRLGVALEAIMRLRGLAGDESNLNGASHAPLSPMNTDSASVGDTSALPQELNSLLGTSPSSNTHPSTSTVHQPSTISATERLPINVSQTAAVATPQCIGSMQLPPQWPQLLDFYFSTTHCWFPICQKHDLLRTAYVLADTSNTMNASHVGDSFNSPSPGESALLWAVLAYSSYRCNPRNNHTQDMYDAANNTISLAQGKFNTDTTRALLVTALLQVDRGQWDAAWVAVGRAIYIASCADSPSYLAKQTTSQLNNLDRRVLLGCFVLETLIAARLQRRPYFQRSDIRAIGLVSEDGIEEWEPWIQNLDAGAHPPQSSYPRPPGRILSIFNHFVQAIGVLNDFLRQSDDDISQASRLQELGRDLKALKERLPPHLQRPFDLDMSPHLLNLHLASANLLEVLKAEAALSTGAPSRAETDTCGVVHQLCRHLETRAQVLGPNSVSSVAKIYMFLLGCSINREEELLPNPHPSARVSGLRASLNSVDHLWPESCISIPKMRNRACSGNTSTSIANLIEDLGSTQSGTQSTSFVDSMSQSTELNHLNSQVNRFSSSLEIGILSPSRLVIDNTLSETPAIPGVRQPIQESPMAQGHGTTQQQSAENMPGATDFASDLNCMELGNPIFGEDMAEDALFDSLTLLDPDDWLANPPDFMRHLGMLRPVSLSPDLQTLPGG